MKSQGIELRPLVDQLVEGVLAVGARLAPEDRAGVRSRPAAPSRVDVLAVRLHRRAAGGRREAVQVLVVGQHGAASRVPKKLLYQTASRPISTGRFSAERRRAEVLVHRVEAGQHLARTGRGRSRSSSTARSPSPASSGRRPSPRSRTCCRCRCRTWRPPRRWSRPRRSAWRRRPRRRPRPASDQSRAVSGVGHRLERREGLRGDDEERLLGVEVAGRLDEVGAVDVGDEAEASGRARL